jgi:predicted nucleic-acid-binding protein
VIGLDANVLVRYFAQDDPIQSPIATELIERSLTEHDPGFVSIVAMVETVWVLERSYGLSRLQISSVVEHMLDADVLVVEDAHEVFIAMTALEDGIGSLSDALIGILGARAGCTHSVTFDRKALRLPYFQPIASH